MRNFYFYTSTLIKKILRDAKKNFYTFHFFYYLYFFGPDRAQLSPKGAGLGPTSQSQLNCTREAISRMQQLCEGN
jgi:hypothetical protein